MIFTTHRFIKRLTAVGITPRLAEALADEARRVCPYNFLTEPYIEQLGTKMVALITWPVGTMMLVSSILMVAALKL